MQCVEIHIASYGVPKKYHLKTEPLKAPKISMTDVLIEKNIPMYRNKN